MKKFSRSFFNRDTRTVARELLGMRLVRVLPDGTRLVGIIVEAEAYIPGDSASHSHRGPTTRNAPMFLRPGIAYVYFTYGMHYCFNIVTEPQGAPAAVLIRALEPCEGIELMRAHRTANAKTIRDVDLCRGPGRLCQALQIDRAFSGYDLQQRGSLLYIEHGAPVPDQQVCTSSRVGISGDPVALAAHWRWYVAGNPYVSRGPRTITNVGANAT